MRREMSLMAPSGHGAMSDLSPLSGAKRKSDLGAVRSAYDPERTIARSGSEGDACSVLFRLQLHRSTDVPDGTRSDHKIAALDFAFAAHDLADRSNRVDDRRAGRIGHEALQRLEGASSRRLSRKRQHVGLSRFEPSNRGFQHLH